VPNAMTDVIWKSDLHEEVILFPVVLELELVITYNFLIA
jgi:hypothetical protein